MRLEFCFERRDRKRASGVVSTWVHPKVFLAGFLFFFSGNQIKNREEF